MMADNDNSRRPSDNYPGQGDNPALGARNMSSDTFGKKRGGGNDADAEAQPRPTGGGGSGGLQRSSTFGMAIGADSLANVWRDERSGGHQQQGQRGVVAGGGGNSSDSDDEADDDVDGDGDDDDDEDKFYPAAAAPGQKAGTEAVYDDPEGKKQLRQRDVSNTSQGINYDGAGGAAEAPAAAGSVSSSKKASGGSSPATKGAAASGNASDNSGNNGGGGGDSKLGKFLEKTGEALHSDRLVERGRQKREDAGYEDRL